MLQVYLYVFGVCGVGCLVCEEYVYEYRNMLVFVVFLVVLFCFCSIYFLNNVVEDVVFLCGWDRECIFVVGVKLQVCLEMYWFIILCIKCEQGVFFQLCKLDQISVYVFVEIVLFWLCGYLLRFIYFVVLFVIVMCFWLVFLIIVLIIFECVVYGQSEVIVVMVECKG